MSVMPGFMGDQSKLFFLSWPTSFINRRSLSITDNFQSLKKFHTFKNIFQTLSQNQNKEYIITNNKLQVLPATIKKETNV